MHKLFRVCLPYVSVVGALSGLALHLCFVCHLHGPGNVEGYLDLLEKAGKLKDKKLRGLFATVDTSRQPQTLTMKYNKEMRMDDTILNMRTGNDITLIEMGKGRGTDIIVRKLKHTERLLAQGCDPAHFVGSTMTNIIVWAGGAFPSSMAGAVLYQLTNAMKAAQLEPLNCTFNIGNQIPPAPLQVARPLVASSGMKTGIARYFAAPTHLEVNSHSSKTCPDHVSKGIKRCKGQIVEFTDSDTDAHGHPIGKSGRYLEPYPPAVAGGA